MKTALKPIPHDRQPVSGTVQPEVREDAFPTLTDLNPVQYDAARRTCKRALFDIQECIRERQWEEALALFYPADEKLPELQCLRQDTRVREKLAFVLGQLKRFDDAIAELQVCLQKDEKSDCISLVYKYFALGKICFALNRYEPAQALTFAEKLETFNPHYPDIVKLRDSLKT